MDTNLPMIEDQTCPAVGYQSASVCVPVTVTPPMPKPAQL